MSQICNPRVNFEAVENCLMATVSSQPVACLCQSLSHYHLLYLLYRHHNRHNQIRPKFTAVRLILAMILRFGVRPGRLDCKDACFHVPPNYAGGKTNSLDTMHVKQRSYRATDIAVCFFSGAFQVLPEIFTLSCPLFHSLCID